MRAQSLLPGLLVILVAALAVFTPPAQAESVETAIMPGKVIEGHADLEGDCKKCHVRFNKSAQSGLCLDCHKEVAKDAVQKQGYHGRLKEQECRTCHTEHKGRGMNIAPLDEKTFDHRLTDFPLKGGHAGPKAKCRDCHLPGKKFRDAPSDCNACHQKDDAHKGSLGKACGNCHVERNWKEVRFDHSSTRFPLLGKHFDVACKDCHADSRFKGAPTQCIACHKKDDRHKTRFGVKCETCHTDKDWKVILFNHDRSTKYPLLGKHRLAKCEGCHSGTLYKDKIVNTTCVACHRKDDERKGHKGRFGDRCESCHVEKDWAAVTFDHDRQTKYPLKGKHAQAKCNACHTGFLFRDKLATTCVACHEKDDKHKGQEGKQCGNCHSERTWKDALFDHGLSRFPLLGKHTKVECKKCHLSATFKDADTACVACHRKDDKHKARLGTDCAQCHNARDWKAWSFDHDRRTNFRLDGGHRGIDCLACHRRPMERKVSLAGNCASCHDEDDVHDGGFGRQCERCHITSSFKKIRPGIGFVPR